MLRDGGHGLLTCRCTFMSLRGRKTRDPADVWAAGCSYVSPHPPLPRSHGQGAGGHALRGNTRTTLQMLPHFHVTIHPWRGALPLWRTSAHPLPVCSHSLASPEQLGSWKLLKTWDWHLHHWLLWFSGLADSDHTRPSALLGLQLATYRSWNFCISKSAEANALE